VAQQVLDVLESEALGEQERRGGMPQVVEADVRQSRPLQRRRKATGHASRLDRRADGRRDDVSGVLPAGATPYFRSMWRRAAVLSL